MFFVVFCSERLPCDWPLIRPLIPWHNSLVLCLYGGCSHATDVLSVFCSERLPCDWPQIRPLIPWHNSLVLCVYGGCAHATDVLSVFFVVKACLAIGR